MIRVTGDGFLRHMVRTIAGTLVDVGLGRWPPETVDGDSRVTAIARGPVAPRRPQGLFLVDVNY